MPIFQARQQFYHPLLLSAYVNQKIPIFWRKSPQNPHRIFHYFNRFPANFPVAHGCNVYPRQTRSELGTPRGTGETIRTENRYNPHNPTEISIFPTGNAPGRLIFHERLVDSRIATFLTSESVQTDGLLVLLHRQRTKTRSGY